MSPSEPIKDLVLLVADKNYEFALRGILSRHRALSLREITFDIFVHEQRDPGCRIRGSDFLRPFAAQYSNALLLFDLIGSGQETSTRETLESHLEYELQCSGWGDRAAVIIIDPELDIWVWSDSPHVDKYLGWARHSPLLREWLAQKGYLSVGQSKPSRPKEALQAAIGHVGMPRSSNIYKSIAEKVSLRRCIDPAFLKLISTLVRWFPQAS